MGKITRTNDRNPLFLCPEGKMFGIQISRGGPREMGVGMKVSDKRHNGLVNCISF